MKQHTWPWGAKVGHMLVPAEVAQELAVIADLRRAQPEATDATMPTPTPTPTPTPAPASSTAA